MRAAAGTALASTRKLFFLPSSATRVRDRVERHLQGDDERDGHRSPTPRSLDKPKWTPYPCLVAQYTGTRGQPVHSNFQCHQIKHRVDELLRLYLQQLTILTIFAIFCGTFTVKAIKPSIWHRDGRETASAATISQAAKQQDTDAFCTIASRDRDFKVHDPSSFPMHSMNCQQLLHDFNFKCKSE